MTHSPPVFRGTELLKVGVLAALVFSAGCNSAASIGSAPMGKDKDKPAAKTPSSPKAAMTQYYEGLCTADEDKLFKAVKADDQQKDLLKALIGFTKVGTEFRDAFIIQYGQAGWTRFNDPNVDPGNGEGNANLAVPDLKEQLTKIANVQIVEKKDEAFADLPDPSGKVQRWRMVMVLQDGRVDGWVVDSASLLTPEGTDVPKLTAELRKMTDLVAKHRKAIGKPGITGDDIDVELGKQVVQELTGTPARGRQRYDVDKLP
jgi:hypothetical protein